MAFSERSIFHRVKLIITIKYLKKVRHILLHQTNVSIMAGQVGFEPTKCQNQNLMPYRLAIALCKDYITTLKIKQ